MHPFGKRRRAQECQQEKVSKYEELRQLPSIQKLVAELSEYLVRDVVMLVTGYSRETKFGVDGQQLARALALKEADTAFEMAETIGRADSLVGRGEMSNETTHTTQITLSCGVAFASWSINTAHMTIWLNAEPRREDCHFTYQTVQTDAAFDFFYVDRAQTEGAEGFPSDADCEAGALALAKADVSRQLVLAWSP